MGTATQYNWREALQRAKDINKGAILQGQTFKQVDWRLPNIKELASIVELSCVDPAINTDIFPNTVSGWYWSSSLYGGYNANAWGVYFTNGFDHSDDKNNNGQVRLVRGGQ